MANTKKKASPTPSKPATKKKAPVQKATVAQTTPTVVAKKKAPAKKKVSSSTVHREPTVAATTPAKKEEKTSTLSGVKIRKSYIIIALSLVAAGLIIYALRGLLLVATVNGQPISRLAVIQELEKQRGQQALESVVIKTLVEQEAQKKRVSVSTDDVTNELKKNEEILKKNGQTLEQFLEYRGLTKEYYLEGLRLQLLAKKIIGTVAITDKQVTDYIAQNEERFAEYKDDKTKKAAAKDELSNQEVGNKINEWLDKLRTSAKVNYIYKY